MWWLVVSGVFAQSTGEEDVGYEIVVQGQRLEGAREEVHQALRNLGYRKIAGDDRALYLTPRFWKPWVVLNDQGFVRVRSLRVLPIPGRRHADEDFPGIMNAPGAGVLPPQMTVSTAIQSRRAAISGRARVVSELEPYLVELRDAHWALAKLERVASVRAEVVGIWVDGVAPDGAPLATWEERREALVARWRHTTEGEDGQWVRDLVEAYVEQVVQVSDHPFAEPVGSWSL